jgi:hypothetical protein
MLKKFYRKTDEIFVDRTGKINEQFLILDFFILNIGSLALLAI